MTPLTRDEAREQVARAIAASLDLAEDLLPIEDADQCVWRKEADAALSVLWPEVERLRIEANRATNHAWEEARGLRAEVTRLRAELDHAHAVIARHVEPRRGPDCAPGAPLTAEQGAPRVPGQDGGERG